MGYAKSIEYDMKFDEYKVLHEKKEKRDTEIKARETEKKKIIELLKVEKIEYKSKKETLVKIHDVKVNYPMKAKLLAVLIKDLNKFGVQINSITYGQSQKIKFFTLNLISSKDENITRLIKHVTKIHTGKFSFSIQKIYYDEENKKYFCELRVVL